MSELYIGRGNTELFDDYMDFLNYVFGFDGRENDFKKLLPKLYKKEYDPASKSYLVMENQKIKAAVGVYENEISVCGMKLHGAGVGNVAVHPYESSKGYMKKLMHMAVEDMKKAKIDYTVLGGQRQRYNYFSYENAGVGYRFRITEANMRHIFADSDASSNGQKTQLKMEPVEENHT